MILLILAILGALSVFLAVVIGAALLLASLLPDEPVIHQTPTITHLPRVPARTRRKHRGVWS